MHTHIYIRSKRIQRFLALSKVITNMYMYLSRDRFRINLIAYIVRASQFIIPWKSRRRTAEISRARARARARERIFWGIRAGIFVHISVKPSAERSQGLSSTSFRILFSSQTSRRQNATRIDVASIKERAEISRLSFSNNLDYISLVLVRVESACVTRKIAGWKSWNASRRSYLNHDYPRIERIYHSSLFG